MRRRYRGASRVPGSEPRRWGNGPLARRVVLVTLLAVVLCGTHRVEAEPSELGKGLFLIAEPTLRDPHFSETVVLITHHGAQGTTGVVINRPTTTRLSEVLPERKELAGRVDMLHIGGPVDRRVLLLLVRTRSEPQHAERVFADVYVSQSLDVLVEAYKGDDPNTAVRLFAGYAGWAPGQLAEEIARGSWRVVPADHAVVFDRDADVIWREMIRRTSEHFI